MVFSRLLARRVKDLLQPWLREELELELKLGLVWSHASATNVRFDAAALNQLLDESSRLSFEDVTVEHMAIRFSNWSDTAFTIEVRGVHVTLSTEMELKGQRGRRSSGNWDAEALEDIKKTLYAIDPEGTTLHDILEGISVKSPNRNRLTTSFLNLILRHCHLQMSDINLLVQFRTGNESFVCFSKLKELNVESEYLDHGCLLRSLVGALVLPLKKSSVIVTGYKLKMGFRGKDYSNRVFYSRDLFICLKLNELQIVDFNFHVPELSISISPVDLPLLMALSELSSKDSPCSRTGRQLWKLAARKIGQGVSPPRLSLHKSIIVVILWLRYANAYEYLLSLVGYSTHHLLKKSAAKMSKDRNFLTSVKHQLKAISDIEEKLPAEAVAQARRIARYKAALKVQRVVDSKAESFVKNRFGFFCKILLLSAHMWRVICKSFYSTLHFIFLRKTRTHETEVDGSLAMLCDYPSPQHCFSLNLGKVSLTVSPINTEPSVTEKLESYMGISFLELRSFCISIDALLLIYGEDIYQKSLSVSCGGLKIKTSSIEGHQTEWVKDMRTILWVEPADIFVLPESSRTSATDHAEGACDSYLENFLKEMWLNWKKDCMKFEESEMQYSEYPCFLCETRNYLVYPEFKNPDCGFQKCNMALGRLNLVLDYSSILSISLLISQIQRVLCKSRDDGETARTSRSPRTVENPPEISSASNYMLYTSEVKSEMLTKLPEKCLQLGVLLAGPRIQISLRKEGIHSGSEDSNYKFRTNDICFTFDVQNIEVAVWPTSASKLAPYSGCQGFHDVELECLRLKKPLTVDVPKTVNEKYTSQGEISLNSYLRIGGLNGHFRDLAEKQQSQILVLEPIVVQLSFVREYLHSLSTTVIAFSAALCGVAQGFTVLAYMDELYVFSKMILGLFSAVSSAINRYHSISCVPFQEFMRQEMMFSETTDEDTTPKGPPFIYKHTILSVNGTFKLPSVDIVLQTSRISNNSESMYTLDALSREKLDNELPDCGIWISIRKTCLKISSEEGKLEVLANFSRFQSVIFRYQNHRGESMDQPELKNLLQQEVNCLYELSLSDFKFTLWFALPQKASSYRSVSNANASSSGSNPLMGNSSLITDPETSSLQSISMVQNLGFASKNVSPASSHCLLINVVLSEIFMVNCSLKNPLVAAHQLNEVLLSLSVEEEFQMVSCGIQGCYLFLEPTALAACVRCFSWYLHFGSNLLSDRRIERSVRSVDATRQNNPFGNQVSEEMLHASAKWDLPESIIINLSHVSFVVVIEEEHGGIREVVLEVNAHLKLELENMRRILVFDLSRLSILSQTFHEDMKSEIQMSKVSSAPSNSESSPSKDGDPQAFKCNQDWIYPADITSCTREPVSPKELSENSFISEASCLDHCSYILKHLAVSISVEKPSGSENAPLILNRAWVGSGSVSGFDVTVSLAEIQMILSTAESFSGIFEKETTSELKQKLSSSNQESENNFEEMIPNGAIVAIQDVHQHMYFSVEGEENNYSLAGAFHYSLVGERALFKVKYDNQRRWKSPVSWFSLISLHAKTNSGEPLRLNCRPRSGFVDISSTDDSNWALWKMLPCEHENYMDDVDWEPHKQLVKNTFYLVNKKNDRAVAFVDGVPEFVTNSGNPFKMKVFHDLHLPPEDGHPAQASGTDHQQEIGSGEILSHPWINISIDKVSFSIVHELSNRRDVFPILRGCVDNIQLIVQILSTKARVINTSSAAIYYYDAQSNFWRELVRPVEISIFYRSSFHAQHKAPVHFYCRSKELEISLAEVSLDILLFIIGELNLAGPFSVRSSLILAKSCKVENKSGLSLICEFYNKRSVTIAGKQSSSIFLRHSTIQDQLSEVTSVVSIQLSVPGSFSTSSISVSHIQDQSLAWRTRIVSPKDSRSYPGPFIVVDISTKTKDGLSIVVSPLIRIHNGTEFPLELRFQRPQENKMEFATWVLKSGDTLDDSMTMLDAINLSGGFKKALMSLSVGNFLLSFRPEVSEGLIDMENPLSVEWSDDLKGGKAVLLSGIFDKLYYKVRKAISIESVNCSFSTVNCSLISEDGHVSKMHFLVQCIRREVPVIQPGNNGDGPESSTVALQEQKEIFLLPTVRVSNLLHSEIHVLLTETDLSTTSCNSDDTRKQATMSSGSAVNFYVNPATIYFNVTLTAFSSSCKPVNSGDWAKKLRKEKDDVHSLDIDLDFGCGKYFASLRLFRGDQGILEATIFTPYALKNDSDFSLFFCELNQKPLSRDEVGKYSDNIPPELGLLLPPKSTESWFLKSNKVRLKLLENRASEALLHLDVLSGAAEISLEAEEGDGLQYITKFGVCVESSLSTAVVPSRTVAVAPRYVVLNKSEESITVRQCYLQDDTAGTILIKSKQRTTLKLCDGIGKRKEYSLFENFIRKHKDDNDDSILFVQFRLNNLELGWSGPICIASLGRFFLKFRKHSNQATASENNIAEIAVVHVVEEGSTFVLQFQSPPNISLPYRIENHLCNASLTYYQKDSSEHEVLGSECSVDYVWDDLTLPHKLVIQINGLHLLREIKLDKVRSWKPLFKTRQYGGLTSHLGWAETFGDQRTSFGKFNEIELVKLGYEIYADGPTRVLRVCEFSDSHQGDSVSRSSAKIQLRISQFAVHLLEVERQDVTRSGPSVYTPIIVARLANINLDSVVADRQMYNQITIEAVNVDEKWVGAPFAAMLRRHQLDHDSNDPVVKIVFVFLSVSSEVKQVRYSSIVLQTLDLNLDEETLMRIVPFWRSSLSESTQSQQFYFDHFEIHPIKIIANFLPGDSYASYTSAQEALRSLLHSVVKVPAISNKVLELNGVLVTHALITMRELLIKCAQHYSWHAMRAICIAKGSPYLPPFCASIFDDLASSSLDVFFDPSRGLRNLPGLTLGTFKLISKCIDGKGFSGTKRYFGDLGKTLRTAGSNVLFATVTEISDSVLKGAETSGFNGMMSGFHQGILHLAMEPSLLGNALMEGGPDRKIKLDRSPGVDELYIEGYLQAMLDTMYKQEYLRVRVIDNQVFLKNLPPNSSLIEEIMDRVRGFLVSKALLKGDSSTTSQPLRHLRGDSEWKFGPTVLTLCEHLFVSFAIRMLRKQSGQFMAGIKLKREKANLDQAIVPQEEGREKVKMTWKWGVGRFVFSTIVAYIDGRLCRCIPNPVARRIVSGFLLSFLDKNDNP